MTETDDRKDEASRRLGGPSKIHELETKLEKIMELSKVHVGRQIHYAGTLSWYDGSGANQWPDANWSIEGLGYDWCVIRGGLLNEVLFAATPNCDIREQLLALIST